MLLISQRNQLFQTLSDVGLQPTGFTEVVGEKYYRLEFESSKTLWFEVRQREPDAPVRNYIIKKIPGRSPNLDTPSGANESYWDNGQYGVLAEFKEWAEAVKHEANSPDLWLESTKALQFFASASAPFDDRFTIAELGAVQGQLNILSKSFGTSGLPAEAKQRLAEIAQTAMLKAEALTKKDWQYWIQGAFSSTVTSLELTEAQIREVVALVRLAFGGLFLQA